MHRNETKQLKHIKDTSKYKILCYNFKNHIGISKEYALLTKSNMFAILRLTYNKLFKKYSSYNMPSIWK